MSETIHLGYEVGTGKPVRIPCRNMVVTGQTQEAGKTTTLEALISRSGLPAVAFVTKRGEQSFNGAPRIAPYFRERADWQFVASVLEATMREKLKFERAWIMRASKGAKTLADVQRNVREQMKTAKGLSADVFLTLDSYLEIVVPRIAMVEFAESVSLEPGLNVLDLSDRKQFPPELQALVMRSVIEWVYEHEDGVISLIPEAWEFIPQGRGAPVKTAAVELIRKGSGLRNYVWLDSQDIGGVEKELLRSIPLWLLGVQREANEIKRTLDNIPASVAKPKPSDLATLERGQFYACWGRNVIKVYVQPEWMEDADAISVAKGEQDIRPRPKPIKAKEDTVSPAEANRLRTENHNLTIENERLRNQLEVWESKQCERGDKTVAAAPVAAGLVDADALYESIKQRLLKDPAILQLRTTKPELQVIQTREIVEIDGKTLRGRIAKLIHSGYFNEPRLGQTVYNELGRLGFDTAKPNVYRELGALAELGFLTKEADGYLAVNGMKVNLKTAQG